MRRALLLLLGLLGLAVGLALAAGPQGALGEPVGRGVDRALAVVAPLPEAEVRAGAAQVATGLNTLLEPAGLRLALGELRAEGGDWWIDGELRRRDNGRTLVRTQTRISGSRLRVSSHTTLAAGPERTRLRGWAAGAEPWQLWSVHDAGGDRLRWEQAALEAREERLILDAAPAWLELQRRPWEAQTQARGEAGALRVWDQGLQLKLDSAALDARWDTAGFGTGALTLGALDLEAGGETLWFAQAQLEVHNRPTTPTAGTDAGTGPAPGATDDGATDDGAGPGAEYVHSEVALRIQELELDALLAPTDVELDLSAGPLPPPAASREYREALQAIPADHRLAQAQQHMALRAYLKAFDQPLALRAELRLREDAQEATLALALDTPPAQSLGNPVAVLGWIGNSGGRLAVQAPLDMVPGRWVPQVNALAAAGWIEADGPGRLRGEITVADGQMRVNNGEPLPLDQVLLGLGVLLMGR